MSLNHAPDKLKASFTCPKCHGKEAIVRRVAISTSHLTSILPLASGKFYGVTCILCGYTEFYDESAFEKQEKKAKNDVRITQEA